MITRTEFNAWLHTASTNPRALGLPHDELRPGQLESLAKMLPILRNQIQFSFEEKSTGWGKSGEVAALAVLTPVTVLVHRRSLALQYAVEYGFDPLLGKDEYECVHGDKLKTWARISDTPPTAADCTYSPMGDCPVAHLCPYLQARAIAQDSGKAVFTYRMALLNGRLRTREGLWVLDEAHTLGEEGLGFAQESFSHEELTRRKLPRAPVVIGRVGLLEDNERITISQWLSLCWHSIEINTSEKQAQSIENARAIKLRNRLERVRTELQKGNWFVECTHEALTLRSLSASVVLSRLWHDDRPNILQSATLGKVDSLARMCGIENYSHEVYPHPVPIECRLIEDLDLPAMTYAAITANPDLLEYQAMRIVAWIKRQPEQDRHLIVTTSNKRIDILRAIIQRELGDRLYIAPGRSLSERVANFTTNTTLGFISAETISGWATGTDWRLGYHVIIAGVQYFNRSDPFSEARLAQMELDMTLDYQDWLAHIGTVQGLGRNVRGIRGADGKYIPKLNAIADKMATKPKAKQLYPVSIRKAIRKV